MSNNIELILLFGLAILYVLRHAVYLQFGEMETAQSGKERCRHITPKGCR